MNIREIITLIMSILTISTVLMVILLDSWFAETLIGRSIAVLALSVTYFGVWVGGVIHGMGQRDENPELLENSDD